MLLFEPIQIGRLQLKNRICMPALHHAYTPEGYVNEKLIRYYETRARGGAAMITVGGCSIDTVGLGPNMIGLHDDRYLEGLQKLTAAVKNAGARICAQLYQAGRYTFSMLTGKPALAPPPWPPALPGRSPER